MLICLVEHAIKSYSIRFLHMLSLSKIIVNLAKLILKYLLIKYG
jgi:hypothetical protein